MDSEEISVDIGVIRRVNFGNGFQFWDAGCGCCGTWHELDPKELTRIIHDLTYVYQQLTKEQ